MSTGTHRRWAVGAAGLGVAATVGGVAFAVGVTPGPDEGSRAADAPSANASASVSAGATGTASEGPTSGPLPVYYVGDTPTGPRLFREFRAPLGREAMDRLSAAVDMAVAAPPTDPDYRSPWPQGTEATASYESELLTVDVRNGSTALGDRPAGLSVDTARMALQQLVHTAQASVQDRAPVQFLLDGEPTDRLLGQPASEPLAEGDPMQVQAPVWVIDPPDDTALAGPVTVEGRGAFFEANVSWQVLQGGEVVEEGFATTEECCTLSPFSFSIDGLSPGDYVLRVYDADMSGGEGPGEHEDTKRFTVSG